MSLATLEASQAGDHETSVKRRKFSWLRRVA